MEEMKKLLTAISEGFYLTSKGSGFVYRNERYMSDYDETFKAILLCDIPCFRNALNVNLYTQINFKSRLRIVINLQGLMGFLRLFT